MSFTSKPTIEIDVPEPEPAIFIPEEVPEPVPEQEPVPA